MWRSVLRFVTGPRRKAGPLMGMEINMITKEQAKRGLMPYAGEKTAVFGNW